MIRRTILFAVELVDRYGTELYWEWPARCMGFNDSSYRYLGQLLRRRGKVLGSARIDGCRYDLQDSHDEHLVEKPWRIDPTDAEFVSEFRNKTCTDTMRNESGPTDHVHTKLMGAEVKRTSYYPPKMCKSIVRLWFRQLRGHRVDADATFLELLAACDNPWETANEFHAVLDFPVDDGSGQPTGQGRKRARAILLRMHRAAQHAHPTRLARMLIDAKKPAWLIREARDLKCDICNSLKPGVEAKVAPVTLRAPPEQWEELAMDVGEFAFEAAPHLCKIKFLLIIDKAGKFIVAPMLRQFGLKENFEPNTGHSIEAFSSRWLKDKPKRSTVVVDEGSSLMSKGFMNFLSEIGILHRATPGQAHWLHGIAEVHIKIVKRTMAKLTAEFPELSPATILSLAVMGHNSGESVRGFSPFQWSYGKGYEPGEFADRHFMGLNDGSASELARRQGLRGAAEAAFKKSNVSIDITLLSFDL